MLEARLSAVQTLRCNLVKFLTYRSEVSNTFNPEYGNLSMLCVIDLTRSLI
jgi:hypothetical protein